MERRRNEKRAKENRREQKGREKGQEREERREEANRREGSRSEKKSRKWQKIDERRRKDKEDDMHVLDALSCRSIHSRQSSMIHKKITHTKIDEIKTSICRRFEVN